MMLRDLRAIVGDEHAREGAPTDRIDGVEPRAVAAPGSVEELSAALRVASRTGWTAAVMGAGTKLGWGNPPRSLDLVLSTRRMDGLIEHAAGDLVVSAQAGMPLGRLQTAVSAAGQMLALDPPHSDGTLGGLIATNASGPRRLRYGTVRDLLIGITVVLADGTIAKSGGKVVKNVAGYDLAKLFTGSLGTLGAIASTIFRLHPRPVARRLLLTETRSADEAGAAIQRILDSTLVPSAIEVYSHGADRLRLALLIEGIEAGVEEQARSATVLLDGAAEPQVFGDERAAAEWRDLESAARAPAAVRLKISYPPSDFARTFGSIEGVAGRAGFPVRVHGHAGTGILHVAIEESGDEIVDLISQLRAEVRPGSVVVLDAAPGLKLRVDSWGPVGDAMTLMRRVKDQFDPTGTLNPGRFVGGI